MANLKNVIYLSNEDYETLVSTGTVTIDGETLTYDENNVYITPDKLASTTEDGLMSAADKSKLNNIESGAQVNVQADWNQTDIGADDYIKNKPEVDTDFSLTSTNALQNKVISEKLDYIDYALTHIKYKLFGVTTLSEIDHKVDYATIYPIPDTLSDDDGTHRVVYSDTQLKEVEGNSVVFNQLLSIRITDGSTIVNGITITDNRDGSFTFSGTSTSLTQYYLLNNQISLTSKHKYLVKGLWQVAGSSSTYDIRIVGNTLYQDGIFTLGDVSSGDVYVVIRSGQTVNVTIKPQIFDLTVSGIDFVTTVDEAKAELLKRGVNVDEYNEFNEGEIRSTVIKGVRIRNSKLATVPLNKISVVDLGTLNWRYISSNGRMVSSSLDGIIKKHSSYVGKPNIICAKYTTDTPQSLESSNPTNLTISIGGNGVDILIYDSSYTDPTIFKSAMRGVLLYFECIESQETISQTVIDEFVTKTIQIPQTNLPSAGSVHDTIKFVEGNVVAGQQRYNMVHVSRVGSDDLGSHGNWIYESNVFRLDRIGTVKNPLNKKNGGILCSKYPTSTQYHSVMGDKMITDRNYWTDNNVIVKDSSYTDTATFKNAMNGVILNYEKNEYTETTLATDLTFEEVSAIIEQGGSIETVFEIVPPNLKTAFVVNKVIVS